MEAEVTAIEYDPIRTARLALLQYKDGEKRYILAPNRIAGGGQAHERPGGAAGNGQLPAAQGDSGRAAHS